MSPPNTPRHRLKITSPGATTIVSVIDNDDRVRAQDIGEEIVVDLAPGIYTVRSELDGRIADKFVRLDKDRDIEAERLAQYSPVPLPYSATSHEYYAEEAWSVAQNPTAPDIPWDGAPTASLMLFIRPIDASRAESVSNLHSFLGLSLHSIHGHVADVLPHECKTDDWSGRVAWHANVSPGLLILESHGGDERQIPIRLVEGFQTQIYMIYHGRMQYEDLRILNVPYADLHYRQGRNPYEQNDEFVRAYEHTDAGLVALNNKGAEIANRLVTKFLQSKFKNPMLGLVGAYLLLLRMHAGYVTDDKTELLHTVIKNLSKLLPGSADLAALKIMASRWLGEPDLEPIVGIPVFRIGAAAVIEEAAGKPELIPEGSLLDIVSDRFIEDSVWTMWEPIPFPLPDHWKREPSDQMSWVELAIADSISEAPHPLDSSEMARHLGVSQHAVRDAYSNLIQRATSNPETVVSEDFDIDYIKLGLINRVGEDLSEPLRPQLMEMSKEINLSYQRVYPQLKNIIGGSGRGAPKIRAADEIEAILPNWSKPEKKVEILGKLERSFGVNLGSLDKLAANLTTVKDLASLVKSKTLF